MNTLIVDDHAENLYFLQSLLKSAGHDVIQAENGEQALERLKTGGTDLIISDILMPVMDGFQLCRKVKTDEALRSIPLIIYTATYTGPQDEAFALKIGADRFIQKPCEPDLLLAAIHEVSNRSPAERGTPLPIEEEESLKLYSERLVRKLEQKMLQAEKEIECRKKAEADRELLRDQLNQSQRLDAIGQLAGGVAHDYNNMLQIILGHTEIALNMTTPSDPLHRHLEEILRAGRRSSEITRQLLAFARKQVVSPVTLDLNNTLEGMLKMLHRLIGENIDLIWNPSKTVWPVNVDPAQIDQVLLNLCVNARDAICGEGRITISTENATVDEACCSENPDAAPGEYAVLKVEDSGYGMDKETLARLFEPFFTTKEAGRGTGLGLATVYGIVRQNNGFIHVYSEPKRGSVFRIYLPRHQGGSEVCESAHDEQLSPGRGETILLVEDQMDILKLGQMLLETLGYTVLACNSPGEALRQAESFDGKIDLLLTDVVMPGMSGGELSAHVRKIRPDARILLMSGYAFGNPPHAFADGEEPLPFLQKPFSLKELARQVSRILQPDQPRRVFGGDS